MTESIKQQLAKHLNGGEAFLPVDELVKKISYKDIGHRPAHLPYSFYELFYHMWFAQRDILDYCNAGEYQKRNWPEDYWPGKSSPESEAEWVELQGMFFEDRREFFTLLVEGEHDLLAEVHPASGHSLLREVLLVIEHNAYHTGQLLVVLRNLGLY